MVTQSITSPVTSISQPGPQMMDGQHNHIPPQNCVPMPRMVPQMESQPSQQPPTPAEKKKKVCMECGTNHLSNTKVMFAELCCDRKVLKLESSSLV